MTLDDLLRKLVYHSNMNQSEQRDAYLLLDQLGNFNVFGNVARTLDPECAHMFERVTVRSGLGSVMDSYWSCKFCHVTQRTLREEDNRVSS